MSISGNTVTRMMDVLLDCLADENVEVREMASQMLSGVVRCSQRQSIIPLRASLMLCQQIYSSLTQQLPGSIRGFGT